jgi:tetratricopeptide (TPR) repeat protein
MTNQPVPEARTLASLLVRANELRRQKDYRAALALYLEALERFGENADLLAMIAGCHFSLALHDPHETGQNYRESVAWMEKAIALAPNDARLHANLADYHQLGTLDYEQAAREYRRAMELNPSDVRAIIGTAALYGVPEEVVTLEEAISWLERATQLEPDKPDYRARLGQFYHEAGRVLDAEREWLKALLCPQPLDPGYVQMIEAALA